MDGRSPFVVCLLVACALAQACGRDEPASPGPTPAGASAVTPTPGVPGTGPAPAGRPPALPAEAPGAGTAAWRPAYPPEGGPGSEPGVVAFPPRNEPFAFRDELEIKYRDGLRRSPSSTYVDLEGDVVWTQEYLRYRVNQCDHASAVQKVLDLIDGRGIAPVCGDPPSGAVPFPPRNQPYAFREELERKYRDGLRRPATPSYVDIEGSVVWIQEYLRYRLNRCGHYAAARKVLDQIDGRGIAPTCVDALSGFWNGTSTYFNAPFTMDIWLNGTSIVGRYVDRHDIGYIGGTYAGGNAVVIDVNFGDTGIRFDGAFDGPDRIRGMIRGGVIGGTYPFEMTRRP